MKFKRQLFAFVTVLVCFAATICGQSLFDSPAPVEKTPLQLAGEAAVSMMNSELTHRVKFRQLAWEHIWQNSRGSAEEILAEIGTKGALLFQVSALEGQFFETLSQLTGKPVSDYIDPKYLSVPEGVTVTLNQDGTVTVQRTQQAPVKK